MKPEEIDKLFKERLGNTAPTPPADLWGRLQDRLETEQEKPAVLLVPEAEQKQEGKQRFMWIYSSVAATLSLLLAVGVVFYNIKTGTPEINETITKYDINLQESTPDAEPILITEPEVASGEGLMAQKDVEAEKSVETEKNIPNQATAETKAASTITKQPLKTGSFAKAEPKASQQQVKPKATVEKALTTDVQPAILANNTLAGTEKSIPDVAPVTKPAAVANANMNAEPVEIIIKRAVATQTAMPEETEQQQRSGGRKALAKNIFKQVRNLASGEGVELEELGIRADRVALETQIGKQKISKVINL